MKNSGANDNLPPAMKREVARAVLDTFTAIYASVHGDDHWTIDAVKDRRFIQRERERLFRQGFL